MGLLKRKEQSSSPKLAFDLGLYRNSSCKTAQDSTENLFDGEDDIFSDSEESVSDCSSEDENLEINIGSNQVNLGAFIGTTGRKIPRY